MNNLNTQLTDIENKIQYQSIVIPNISKSAVGWHIEHILLTINAIINVIKKSQPENFKSKHSLLKTIVFALKKIPRGKAKAPQFVIPIEYSEESLKTHLANTKQNIIELYKMNSNQYFSHPYFGDLRLKKAIQFIEIHTNHHLKIINDILKNK